MAKFKILNIDQDGGSVEVEYINPYGPIESKEKTLEDFLVESPRLTDEFDPDTGERKIEMDMIPVNNNPNDNLIYAIDIPLTEEGNYVGQQKLLNHITRYFPTNEFETYLSRKNARHNGTLDSLVNQEIEMEIVEPEPTVHPKEEEIIPFKL